MLGFCATLSAADRAEAYGHEATALMALRCMSGVQQVLVARLLFAGAAGEGAGVRASEAAVAELLAWGVAERQGSDEDVRLLPVFAASLQRGLSAAPPPQTPRLMGLFVERAQAEAQARCALFVFAFVVVSFFWQRWDSAIQTIGDPTARLGERKHNPDLVLVQTALAEGLLTSTKKKRAEASDCALTREGFMFLLADTHEQLWALLLGFFRLRASRGKLGGAELAAALAFVCRLGLAEAYRPAPAASAPSRELLQLCACLGVAVLQGAGFVVTAYARHLSPRSAADESAQGFLVLENNFRVYAYTQSLLHIRILSMFVRLEYRLPNLVVGTVTRQSALRALLRYGVSAAQLLHYLRSNAHPRLRLRNPVVPDAIADQLRAWEAENSRLSARDGVLFEQFPSREAHEFAVRVAQARGVLLWSKPWRPGQLDGFVFVTREGVEPLTAALNSISL